VRGAFAVTSHEAAAHPAAAGAGAAALSQPRSPRGYPRPHGHAGLPRPPGLAGPPGTTAMRRPPLEGADVVRQHGETVLARYGHPRTGKQPRALRAIALGRTAALGGHSTQCDHCGREVHADHSCRRVMEFPMQQLPGRRGGVRKRCDPREGFPSTACPYTSQNTLMEQLRWYHRPVRGSRSWLRSLISGVTTANAPAGRDPRPRR
jgi:Transposase zinc-binding domain